MPHLPGFLARFIKNQEWLDSTSDWPKNLIMKLPRPGAGHDQSCHHRLMKLCLDRLYTMRIEFDGEDSEKTLAIFRVWVAPLNQRYWPRPDKCQPHDDSIELFECCFRKIEQ